MKVRASAKKICPKCKNSYKSPGSTSNGHVACQAIKKVVKLGGRFLELLEGSKPFDERGLLLFLTVDPKRAYEKTMQYMRDCKKRLTIDCAIKSGLAEKIEPISAIQPYRRLSPGNDETEEVTEDTDGDGIEEDKSDGDRRPPFSTELTDQISPSSINFGIKDHNDNSGGGTLHVTRQLLFMASVDAAEILNNENEVCSPSQLTHPLFTTNCVQSSSRASCRHRTLKIQAIKANQTVAEASASIKYATKINDDIEQSDKQDCAASPQILGDSVCCKTNKVD